MGRCWFSAKRKGQQVIWLDVLAAMLTTSLGTKINLVIQTGPPPDVDNYIHRAGRTGRAGKNGVSVVLYGNDELKGMAQVEKRAGIQFGDVKGDAELLAIVR